jgi:hypothetical protein
MLHVLLGKLIVAFAFDIEYIWIKLYMSVLLFYKAFILCSSTPFIALLCRHTKHNDRQDSNRIGGHMCRTL